MATNHTPVTELLRRWSQGDKTALDSLMPLIYEDLRRLANFYLQQENNARTLQSTRSYTRSISGYAVNKIQLGPAGRTFSPSQQR
jgi:hypothetical protein